MAAREVSSAATSSEVSEQSDPPMPAEQTQLARHSPSLIAQTDKVLPEVSVYMQVPLPEQTCPGTLDGQVLCGAVHTPAAQ
jgi:hypothetical protein